jgi:acyl-CoA thioesterase FadM
MPSEAMPSEAMPSEGPAAAYAHSEDCLVRCYDVGPDERLRPERLCNYFEEAAGRHAAALGLGIDRLARDGHAWVLAKMRLVLSRLPRAGERLRVTTWPVRVERLQFRRDFMAYDEAGAVPARAVTQWVIINLATRRLERFPAHIAALAPANPASALDDGDIRIPALDERALPGPSFPVRLADIDRNRHVNNSHYVEFALEAALSANKTTGASAAAEHDRLAALAPEEELRGLDILFRAEGRFGDLIATRGMPEPDAPGSCLCSLYRRADGTELARARTLWGVRGA